MFLGSKLAKCNNGRNGSSVQNSIHVHAVLATSEHPYGCASRLRVYIDSDCEVIGERLSDIFGDISPWLVGSTWSARTGPLGCSRGHLPPLRPQSQRHRPLPNRKLERDRLWEVTVQCKILEGKVGVCDNSSCRMVHEVVLVSEAALLEDMAFPAVDVLITALNGQVAKEGRTRMPLCWICTNRIKTESVQACLRPT